MPAKAAHFRVWLPRKKLAVTQSTCGNDTFGYCGAVRHHRARGRAHGRATLVANTSGTAYRSNRKDSITAVLAGIAAKLLGKFSSRTTLLMQTTLARASEVRGADATNVTQAWFYRGEFMSWGRLVTNLSGLTKRRCLLQHRLQHVWSSRARIHTSWTVLLRHIYMLYAWARASDRRH